MKKNTTVSSPKIGMNRTTHGSLLKQEEYSFALNANNTTEQGERLNITNEPSNILAVEFPQGYIVIGYKYNSLLNKTYLLLTNPETGFSSIGYIDYDFQYVYTPDEENSCGDCYQTQLQLGTPLEDLIQTANQTYVELLNDECNGDLAFDINYPFLTIEIKTEKNHNVMYFTNGKNTGYYLNLSDIEYYKYEGEYICGVDVLPTTCIDVSKMKIFPSHRILQIDPETIQNSGNLKLGTYTFYASYCDAQGNEITNYSTPTNPVRIFDENNFILEQPDLDNATNFAIKLKINNLDTQHFKYYKVIVQEISTVAKGYSYFVAGIYPTTNNTVLYTSNLEKDRASVDNIKIVKPTYETIDKLVASNNTLFLYGLKEKRQFNLQPVVNLFSSLLKWSSSIAKEALYKNPIPTSKYVGYRRDEVQPFSIRFRYKDGGLSPVYPFIGRPANTTDLETISVDDINYQSIHDYDSSCTENDRTKRWQLFNTASVTDVCSTPTDNAIEVVDDYTRTCLIENVATIPTDVITFEPPVGYTDFETFLNEYRDDPSYYIPEIAPYLTDTYPDDHCTPIFQGECSTPVLSSSVNLVGSVNGEVVTNIYKREAEYQRSVAPKFCNNFLVSMEDGKKVKDTAFIADFLPCGVTVYERNSTDVTNESCAYAVDIINYPTYQSNLAGYYHNYYGNSNANPLLSTLVSDGDLVQNVSIVSGTTGSITVVIDGTSYAQAYLGTPAATMTAFFSTHEAAIETQTGGTLTYSSGVISLTNALILIDTVIPSGDVIPSYTVTGNFAEKLHKNALFFKGIRNGRNELVLEITKNSNCATEDYLTNSNFSRVSIFDSCSSGTLLHTEIINTNSGLLKVIDTSAYLSTFIVAIDTPLKKEVSLVDECGTCGGDDQPACTYENTHVLYTNCGCFAVLIRDTEVKEKTVEWESIIIDKQETYTSTCTTYLPQVGECDTVPFQKGEFSYWESTETYPNNSEVYDSSNLIVLESDLNLSPADKAKFKEYYTESVIDGTYTLKTTTDFRCAHIRHFKMPDNRVSPFMYESTLPEFAGSFIFPLGVELDSSVVNTMLSVAVRNNLISQEELNNIDSYEILRGDTAISKSIISSGLAYDMYKYEERGKVVHYPNYPHNDLSDDKLHYTDGSRNQLIKHPNNRTGNSKYSYISPDIFYNRITNPTELTIDGYQLGNSRGSFQPVNGHPKWTILSSKGRDTATLLGVGEATLELAAQTSNMIVNGSGQSWFTAGVSSGTNIAGTVISAIALAVYLGTAVSNTFIKAGKYRYEWLKILRDLGQPKNFSSYYVSEGYHNSFSTNTDQPDSLLRAITVSKFLKDGKYSFRDEKTAEAIKVNSWMREHSMFISLGDYDITYPTTIRNWDNSRVIASDFGCTSAEESRLIATPYITLKNYVPDQHGTIDSVNWLTTNYIRSLSDNTICDPIFGGTVFVSRFTWKRKLPIFKETAMGEPNLLPYSYSLSPNIGNPRFFCDYETGGDVNVVSAIFPDIKSNTFFDCDKSDSFYKVEPSKFYLYYYGITNFLVESEINCNFRYGRKDAHDQFYPAVGDMVEWTQEKNTTIKEPNTFFYNNIYSQSVFPTKYTILDRVWSTAQDEIRRSQENGVIYSIEDRSENDLVDPWLVFKPLNWYEFPKKYGKLVHLKDLESAQILGRFENQMVLFNAIDTVQKNTNMTLTQVVGTGGIFAQRPLEFKATDLGFAGTQHTDMVSTPYGHFSVDAKRGKIFQLDSNGKDLQPISDILGNRESGMKQWFQENLPFRILKSIPELDIDNKFKGVGISMGWDAKFERVFITKKDYVLKSGINKNNFTVTADKKLMYQEEEVFFTNTNLFEDVSWTIAYKVSDGVWISYYSFMPNFYIGLNDHFQTYHNDKLWSHLLTNQSYCVFYGEKHPFIIEVPIVNENANKVLESVKLEVEGKRYQNKWDFAQMKDVGFNQAVIYNNTNNSGMLNLKQRKSLKDHARYPITNSNNSQDILYTSQDGEHTFNYFYNRAINQDNNVPQWLNDRNRIHKTINPMAVNFSFKKKLNERLRGDYFYLRLIKNDDSRYNVILRNLMFNEQLSQ